MFSIDLEQTERLKDILFRSSSQSDEGLYILRKLQEEIDGDILLSAFEQSSQLSDDLLTASKSLAVIKETLYDLGRITSDTTEEYRSSEKNKVDRILQKEE